MKKKTDKKITKQKVITIIVVMAMLYGFFAFDQAHKKDVEAHTVPYKEFLELLDNEEIEEIRINFEASSFSFFKVGDEDTKYYTDNPKYDELKRDLLNYDVKIVEKGNFNIEGIISSCFSIIMLLIVLSVLAKQMNGMSDIGKDAEKVEIRLSDVAGLTEVKEDVQTIIDFLKSPKKYADAGAKLPSGILFCGPPGTGKTLLAKAIAGEAGVNFISLSGSDFSNKYIGVAGDRVRKLFAKAREKAPCIVFIDELDAVGGKRNGQQHPEERNTLNALLAEMDGFAGKDGVFVIAATNRVEDLDEALVRPGRFDNIFTIPLPTTTSDRMAVVQIHAKDKHFSDDVDLQSFAKQMMGCSPAAIATIINEAAIIAARDNRAAISNADLDAAYLKKILKGHVTQNPDRDEADLRLVAWHEAGHALMGILHGQTPSKITIAPSTSGAGGFTVFAPSKLGMYTKKDLENNIRMLYAGRAAEELLVGSESITNGAANDITQATKLLHAMVSEYGMGGKGNDAILLDFSAMPNGNQYVSTTMQSLSRQYYSEAVQMLKENREKLEVLASALLEKETLNEVAIQTILLYFSSIETKKDVVSE